jgi:hypothetical protein
MKPSEYILAAIVALAVIIVLMTLSGCGGGTEDETPTPRTQCVPAEVCR